MLEQNTFRRIDENTVALDGLIYSTNTDKMIKVLNTDTDGKVFSVKVEDVYYYPVGFDKNNRKKNYVQIIDKEKH
jgi:hypothetical protein